MTLLALKKEEERQRYPCWGRVLGGDHVWEGSDQGPGWLGCRCPWSNAGLPGQSPLLTALSAASSPVRGAFSRVAASSSFLLPLHIPLSLGNMQASTISQQDTIWARMVHRCTGQCPSVCQSCPSVIVSVKSLIHPRLPRRRRSTAQESSSDSRIYISSPWCPRGLPKNTLCIVPETS